MTKTYQESFPLHGVIGIVTNDSTEVDQAVNRKLGCVEIRADLLLDRGLSIGEIISTVRQAREQQLAVLFTLRHPGHGGTFKGTEQERVSMNQLALDAGADLIDLEWGTEAAELLLAAQAPMILSYHDFNAMLSDDELIRLTRGMTDAKPRAIKVVPTASSVTDAIKMLEWVSRCSDEHITKIGFAMGDNGTCSRLLTIALGAPITYATFGEINAPGQISMDELLITYRVETHNQDTVITAVISDESRTTESVNSLNQQYANNGENRVAIGFSCDCIAELERHAATLRIGEFFRV